MAETPISLKHPDGRSISFKMDLDPTFVSDQHIIEYVDKQTCYESDVAWVMMRTLRTGDGMVDAGACVGFFTLLARQLVGESGHVVTVEPGTDNLLKLKKNLELNQIPFGTKFNDPVTIVDQPLFARAEPVTFYYSEDSSGGHALWNPGAWHENEKTRKHGRNPVIMNATTLNRISPSPCRLVKIDTEGAEERVLQGGNNMLAVIHPPFVIAEFNAFGLQQMMCSPDSLRQYMRMHGYDTFMLYPDGAKPELVPPRKNIVCDHIWNVLFSTPSDVASIWR